MGTDHAPASAKTMPAKSIRVGKVVPAALATAWEHNGFEPTALNLSTDGTLLRPSDAEPTPASPVSESALGEISLSEEGFERLEVLGQGGMGVVYLAAQPSLRREVALKCLSEPTARSVSALLKEGWVAGALQHPNIVPVHTMTRHEGAPAIAMKRIEGTSWRTIIEDPSRRPTSQQEPIETWHLQVFGQVCRAMEFAHSRGILHLDLKPDNVMIGEYGEVWVVDWGLAAGVAGCPEWLSPARDIRGIAGTPSYLAPETAAANPSAIDVTTDVYLLGATLHHALFGAPRHRGDSVLALLYQALKSEPQGSDTVHSDLVDLLNRACHADPQQRFSSVSALREAVETHLRHRESNRLIDQARRALDELRALPADGADLVKLEIRCRFAVEQARRSWPDSPAAAEVQSELVEDLLEKALGRWDLAAAERLRGETDSDRYDARINKLRERARLDRERVAHAERLIGDHDVGRAMTQRRRLFVALGLIWLTVSAALGFVQRRGILEIGYEHLLFEGALIAAFFTPFALLRRKVFFQNRANARMQGLLILTAVATELLFVTGWALDVPFASALALTPLLYAFGFGALAIALDLRLMIGALFQLIALASIPLAPSWAFEIIGLCALFSAATTWRWPAPQRSDPSGVHAG